ncbi:MAG TPA: glutamate--tRNA ligase [Mycobacteriales bacterium]|jgi:glutamyl-tRNA synthetase|nr:glutamate--tRNA ligase [Mycobacteriales bacterium]
MTVRVRFPPSPTGDLHVGNVRSALFNWAFARHAGGSFVLRIEDTDAARSTEASYRGVLDQLRWLGLDWDEGPEVGGPYAPYLQSQRMDIYADVIARLREAGYAYESYSNDEEVRARRAARGDKTQGYDNHDRSLTAAEIAAFQAEGRPPVLRFRMPDEAVVFEDLVRGEVRFEPENVPDFVLARADGSPLYPLTNPVDDALMGITHVLRGDDLLASTPRQIPLQAALRELGLASGPMPRYGHLPMVLGEGKQRLSKRKTPEASLANVRAEGFLPEGILNYLALLGWSMGGDQELFTPAEMVEAFTVERISRNPATFDVKKLTAINGIKIRGLSPEDFVKRLLPFLVRRGVFTSPTDAQLDLVAAAAPLVQERAATLVEAADLLGFFFVPDHHFAVDPAAAAKVLTAAAAPVLDAAVTALGELSTWTHPEIQEALEGALVTGLGLKPRVAYGPVRVAVTGRTVSPPLFESIELLGRGSTLDRLRAARAGLGTAAGMG